MIIKSKNDQMKYFLYTLSNGIKCLLINDKHSNKSCCSLCVGAGSLNEPKETHGLAHLLEHMLFMGSLKFPNENGFFKYLSQNSGDSNAYTDLTHTNYFFEIKHTSFNRGLDIFSNFFISPLLNKNSISRELHAVHSENEKNLSLDNWRLYQMVLSLSNPLSRFNIFPTGNNNTLNIPSIQRKLIDFFNEFYNGNMMSICLLSPQPIPKQKLLVNKYFSLIKRGKNDNIIDYNKPCYPYMQGKNLGKLYKIIPIENKDTIIFQYHIPFNLNKYNDYKPFDYISEIIRSVLKGSLYDGLFNLGYIRHLNCNFRDYAQTFGKFNIEIELTKSGLSKYNDIIALVTKYVDELVKSEIDMKYLSQLQRLRQMNFDYKSKENELDYCQSLSRRLLTIKNPNEVLIEPYWYKYIDTKILKQCISCLNKDNLNVFILSQSFKGVNEKEFHTEKWYNTQYIESNLKICKTSEKQIPYKYPKENPYIPKDFSVIQIKDAYKGKYPEICFKSKRSKIYFKQDFTFKTPKSCIFLKIDLQKDKYLKNDKTLAAMKICNFIYQKIFDFKFTEVFQMKQAGINIDSKLTDFGFSISISGFSQHIRKSLLHYLNRVWELINNPPKDLYSLYSTYLHQLRQELINTSFQSPYIRAMDYYQRILSKYQLPPNIIYNECCNKHDIYKNYFQEYLNEIFKDGTMTWLIQGNITLSQAKAVVKEIEDIFSFSGNFHIIKPYFYSIKRNCIFKMIASNQNEVNNCLISYYENKSLSSKSKCEVRLIKSILNEGYFNTLRTKYSIGYIVSLLYRQYQDKSGVLFLAQSGSQNPLQISQYNKKFIRDSTELINKLPKEMLNRYISSEVSNLNRKDISIESEFLRNCAEIANGTYSFNKNEIYSNILQSLTIKDIQVRYRKLFDSKKMDNLFSIQLFSYKDGKKVKVIPSKEDFSLFRQSYLI